MNSQLKALVEEKLCEDLESFEQPFADAFEFDWSEVVGEGDEVEYLGDQLETHPLPRSFDSVSFKRESEKLIDLAREMSERGVNALRDFH